MMNIAARFSLSYETKVYQYEEEKPIRLKVMLTGLITLQQGRRLRHLLTCLQPVATQNLHTTQPSTLFPTYDEVVNLTGLLETKGMSVSSGKQ
jgi:hypothetical protein